MSRKYTKKKDSNKDPKYREKRGRNSNARREEMLDSRGRDNDPNWYFSNAELANQAAQLSFQSIMGLTDIESYKVPTIARAFLASTPGTTVNVMGQVGQDIWFSDLTQPSWPTLARGKAGINLMAAKLYTLLSTFSGRTATYGPQDVGLMILAAASVTELSEAIRRMFGIALTYNPRSRVMPLALLQSMGIDPDDMTKNIAVYRMRFNIAMSRLNQIPLLDNIGYIKKSRDIYQNVYSDDPTSMAQLFFYTPRFVWRINETSYSGGTVLDAIDLPYYNAASVGTRYKMSDWLDILEGCITELLESSTLNLIYADLLNMANKLKTPTWQFDYLAENYVVMPIFNRNALLQFHNMSIIEAPFRKSGSYVDQVGSTPLSQFNVTTYWNVASDASNNEIIFNPIWKGNGGYNATRHNAIVDMDTDNPTLEDRIEALRYLVADSGAWFDYTVYTPFSINDNFTAFRSLPDHVCDGCDILSTLDSGGNMDTLSLMLSNRVSTYVTQRLCANLSQFEHAPIIFSIDKNSRAVDNVIGQLQFWTMVDYNYLKRLCDIVTIGLFDFRVSAK